MTIMPPLCSVVVPELPLKDTTLVQKQRQEQTKRASSGMLSTNRTPCKPIAKAFLKRDLSYTPPECYIFL